MKNKDSKKAFFASFLEKQLQDPEKIKGGGDVTIASQDTLQTCCRYSYKANL
jgi:parvulin-like peptidyl-prolyl isomerase